MQPSGSYFNNHILLITILAIGMILRFYGLDIQSLWLDEPIAWEKINQESIDIVLQSLRDGKNINPPGYFIVIYFVTKYLGNSEILLRLPSTISGVISVYAIYLLGKLLYSDKEGLLAAALTAVL